MTAITQRFFEMQDIDLARLYLLGYRVWQVNYGIVVAIFETRIQGKSMWDAHPDFEGVLSQCLIKHTDVKGNAT